jgi:uncharacterized protein (DUF111 family)
VVVGVRDSESGTIVFRWTAATGAVDQPGTCFRPLLSLDGELLAATCDDPFTGLSDVELRRGNERSRLVDALLADGALDAYVLPATMKKGRPGHLIGVVVGADRRDAIIDRLLRESTSLGVRFQRVERVALERRFDEVTTEYGKVTVKVGLRGDEVLNAAPEFDDCRRLAEEKKVAIKEVQAAAIAAWRKR